MSGDRSTPDTTCHLKANLSDQPPAMTIINNWICNLNNSNRNNNNTNISNHDHNNYCDASRDAHRKLFPTTCACVYNDKPAQNLSRVSGGCVSVRNDTTVDLHAHKPPQQQLILFCPPSPLSLPCEGSPRQRGQRPGVEGLGQGPRKLWLLCVCCLFLM